MVLKSGEKSVFLGSKMRVKNEVKKVVKMIKFDDGVKFDVIEIE